MGRRVCLHRPDYGFTARRGQMVAEVSPPSRALIYTHIHTHTWQPVFHRTITLQPLPALTHSHTYMHTPRTNYGHSQGMITATHTHKKLSGCAYAHTHSTSPPALGGKKKIWQPVLLMKDTAASCSFENPTDRQTETLLHIWHRFLFFLCSVCLFA